MTAEEFVQILRNHGVSWFTGVPCSFFQSVYTYLERDAPDHYVPAANEGIALAMAAGAELAGRRTAVLIQNSGLGNLFNPLTSLHAPYGIPALLFVSGRGLGVSDEPQHELMGRITEQMLVLAEANVRIMETNAKAFEQQLSIGLREGDPRATAFIVPKGTIAIAPAQPRDLPQRPLSRPEVLKVLAASLPLDAVVLSTTGRISRDWFELDDRPRNFYAMGCMGHVMSIALGVAAARPGIYTVALDGDGSLLMHLGALSTIGSVAPRRFLHVVIDNEAYESTGSQRTSSATTDFVAVALACGYRFAETAETPGALRDVLERALSGDGPAMIRVKVNLEGTREVPRITSRHTAPEVAARFRGFLQDHP